MIEITKDDAAQIMARFYDFADGVVDRIELDLPGKALAVVVLCQDAMSTTGWSSVRFLVTGVEEFRLELGKTTFEVLSSGIQFLWRQNLVYLVLDAYPDDPETSLDLTANRAFVGGLRCEMEVSATSV